jgi:hypothetical protein
MFNGSRSIARETRSNSPHYRHRHWRPDRYPENHRSKANPSPMQETNKYSAGSLSPAR